MKSLTITIEEADKIKIPVWNSNIKRSMFQFIVSSSLFNPYTTTEIEEELDMHVTYTVRDNGYLKDVFLTDSTGKMLVLSNKLTFKNYFYLIN